MILPDPISASEEPPRSRAQQRALPEALASQWGERVGDLPWGTVRLNQSAAWRLRRVLQAHAADMVPRILGGGSVDGAGVLHQCVVRYAQTEGAGSRKFPTDVVVTVDLRSGLWRTSQGDEGTDIVSLARWYWCGSAEARRAGGGVKVEDRLLAHLGLAALDIYAGLGGGR
jgi:hypothetical protein